MSDVDFYIARFPTEVQERLMSIRLTALNAFEDMEERTYHGLPALSTNGKVIMFYGAYQDHISVCVGYDWVDFLRSQYPQFQYTKATITFGHNAPFPDDIVQVICELLKQSLHGVPM